MRVRVPPGSSTGLTVLGRLGVAAFVAVGLAGCGSATAPGQTATDGGSTPAPTLGFPPPPTTVPTLTFPPPTSPSGTIPGGPDPTDPALPRVSGTAGLVTVTGIPQPGIRQSCLLLDGYLLLGGNRTLLSSGAKVTVTGHVAADVMSYCQQGKYLVVDSVTKVP